MWRVGLVTHRSKGSNDDDVDDADDEKVSKIVDRQLEQESAVAIAQGAKNGNRSKVSFAARLAGLPCLKNPILGPKIGYR